MNTHSNNQETCASSQTSPEGTTVRVLGVSPPTTRMARPASLHSTIPSMFLIDTMLGHHCHQQKRMSRSELLSVIDSALDLILDFQELDDDKSLAAASSDKNDEYYTQ